MITMILIMETPMEERKCVLDMMKMLFLMVPIWVERNRHTKRPVFMKHRIFMYILLIL